MLGNSSAEARIEYYKKIVTYLSVAVTKYIFDGLVREPRVSLNEETGEINMYLKGVSSSLIPMLRPARGDSFRGVVEVLYDFGGLASIKDDKLKLELARRRVLEKREDYGVVIIASEYESRKNGLYYLRKLSKMDEMLPFAIWLLGEELDVKGVGEEKRIDIEYDMLTGDLKIELCGDDIIESLKGRKNTHINKLYSLIHGYQDLAGRKCIELEGKKEQAGIWLNTKYIIEKDSIEHEKYIIDRNTYFLEKEKIPEVLNIILSEETLNRKYVL
ncbi:Uncharacterized protein Nst1_005 [Candidatus Nanobsidianus stetteri]|uniref:Uncharacterized protein n=1 Tax=Nanobsidianus stetteri TaxID=1294122 RepID=R1E5J8_NANST|nr:Uncharacterized protein Nst1_005 [Candidatus Nanobsidianus stetteri]